MSLFALKQHLAGRLDPVDDWDPAHPPLRSDFDLNPNASRRDRALQAAAVLVPLIARPTGVTVLLTRRADTLANHTGQIAFPGGRLDAGETAVEAALREAWEEVALNPAGVEVLGVCDGYETVTGFLVTPVIGWLDAPPVTRLAPNEVAEAFEVPWDFLMNPANHRRDFYDPETGPRRWFWALPYEQRYIWGATAAILRGLYARLYGNDAAVQLGETAA